MFGHKKYPIVRAFLLAAFLIAFLSNVCMAQRSTQDGLRSRVMERLSKEEAAELFGFFKAQRLEENFCFRFQLEHKPRRGRTVRYEGILYGSWNEEGPISRFKLFTNAIGNYSPEVLSSVEMIVQNGTSPKVWVRRESSLEFTLIEDEALFEPIFEGVLYTPFDLQMPFIFWNKYDYEGPSRVLSRIGQDFLMFPPADSLAKRYGMSAVRVSIDDTYYALLRAEVLQDDKKVRSRFTVRGIKKIQDRYIVKEVELKNMLTKDATTFKVKAAGIGLEFTDSMFNPEEAGTPPKLSEIQLELL